MYLGGRDASGDITGITPDYSADTHDTTTLGDEWYEATAGLLGWEAAIEAFYDPDAGGIGRQMEDLLGATGGVLSIFDSDADAIGDTGILGSDSILTKRSQPTKVADLVRLNAALKPTPGTNSTTRAGFAGRLLHVLGQETETGTETELDNGAASASGGRANLHVTAITGTWTIAVQESSTNDGGDPYEAKAEFASITAVGGYTVEVSGAVEQYLRASHTEDVAGSITYVLGFARY